MLKTLYRIVDQGDPCALVLLIGILALVGLKTVEDRPGLQRAGFLIAVVAFVAFCGEYLVRATPKDAQALLRIGVRGLLMAGLTLGTCWILLPLLAIVYAATIGEAMRKAHYLAEAAKRTAEEKARQQAEAAAQRRREEAERAKQALPVPPVTSPPTREERMAAALKRYKAKLRELNDAELDEIELKAAQELAKQQYLRELDDAMQ